MSVVFLIVGLILFVGLVVVHELGHFFVARRNGVEAEEFGIGFPPRAWSREVKGRKGKPGFLFSINWLPIGGFVKLKGEHDADTDKGSFGAATTGVKTKIMLAGVGMNLLAAFVLFMILAWTGMPQLVDNQFTVKSDTKVSNSRMLVGFVEPGSPAAKAGLQERDDLISIGLPGHAPVQIAGTGNTSEQNLPNITKQFAGQTVRVIYMRSGQTYAKIVTLLSQKVVAASQKTSTPKGYLGISPTSLQLTRSTWSAPIVSLGLIKQFTVLTFKGLGSAVSGLSRGIAESISPSARTRHQAKANFSSAGDNVSGPVGIFVILKDSSALGFQYVLMIIAIISLTLAIMNVLPIPALDGGRLFLFLISRALKKPLTEELEDRVVGTGFAVLMLLILVITIVDVKRYL